MGSALYPGSFDPITLGHVDIIRRLQPLYDEVIVLVAKSHNKSYLFSDEERRDLVLGSLEGFEKVRVELFDGLTVDYARKMGSSVIVRGIRAVADFEYEMAIAHMNKKLDPTVETMIMLASPESTCISSRMVKEVAFYQGDLKGLVPDNVRQALVNRFC